MSRAGKRLKGFCRTNLFKRPESSAHAFLLSVHRHILRNEIFIHALESKLSIPIGQQDAALLDTRIRDQGDGELDLDDGEPDLPPLHQWDEEHYHAEGARLYRFIADHQPNRYRWIRYDVFKRTLVADLRRDARALHAIIAEAGDISPEKDFKFQALLRLIQRAGRVDRIGQKSEVIHCYSFLPAEGVERIIRLRRRLVERLHQNAEVVGSDEAFFEAQTPTDEEALHELYNEKSGILDEPEDDEVDLT